MIKPTYIPSVVEMAHPLYSATGASSTGYTVCQTCLASVCFAEFCCRCETNGEWKSQDWTPGRKGGFRLSTHNKQTPESSKQTEKQTRNKPQKAANSRKNKPRTNNRKQQTDGKNKPGTNHRKPASRRKNKPGTKHGVVRKRSDKVTVYKEDEHRSFHQSLPPDR